MKIAILLLFFCSSLFAEVISSEKIREIYDQYVVGPFTEEYKQRYVPLPMHKNSSPWKWEGKDFARVIAILEFDRFVQERGLSSENGLAINPIEPVDPEWHWIPYKKITKTDYEADPIKYDLHTLDLEEKDFDFVTVNQTLEHVYDPLLCLKNIHAHMRKGGILYFNVPVNNIPHSVPFHFFTGFTPVQLGILVHLAGFQILSIGQWGNEEYLVRIIKTQGWPDYKELEKPEVNEFHNPAIAWIFAIKE